MKILLILTLAMITHPAMAFDSDKGNFICKGIDDVHKVLVYSSTDYDDTYINLYTKTAYRNFHTRIDGLLQRGMRGEAIEFKASNSFTGYNSNSLEFNIKAGEPTQPRTARVVLNGEVSELTCFTATEISGLRPKLNVKLRLTILEALYIKNFINKETTSAAMVDYSTHNVRVDNGITDVVHTLILDIKEGEYLRQVKIVAEDIDMDNPRFYNYMVRNLVLLPSYEAQKNNCQALGNNWDELTIKDTIYTGCIFRFPNKAKSSSLPWAYCATEGAHEPVVCGQSPLQTKKL